MIENIYHNDCLCLNTSNVWMWVIPPPPLYLPLNLFFYKWSLASYNHATTILAKKNIAREIKFGDIAVM